MRQIIKGHQVVNDDWVVLPKEVTIDELTSSGNIIVPLAFWLDHGPALKARDGGLGIWLDSDEEAESIANDLTEFQVIALNFPIFSDGRNYSNARLLRDRYQYTGELRAIGDVLRDQMFYMRRCGFDSYALREDNDPHAALASLNDFSEVYQASTDQPLPLFRRRQ